MVSSFKGMKEWYWLISYQLSRIMIWICWWQSRIDNKHEISSRSRCLQIQICQLPNMYHKLNEYGIMGAHIIPHIIILQSIWASTLRLLTSPASRVCWYECMFVRKNWICMKCGIHLLKRIPHNVPNDDTVVSYPFGLHIFPLNHKITHFHLLIVMVILWVPRMASPRRLSAALLRTNKLLSA